MHGGISLSIQDVHFNFQQLVPLEMDLNDDAILEQLDIGPATLIGESSTGSQPEVLPDTPG